MNFLNDIRFFNNNKLDLFNKDYKVEYCYLLQKQLKTGGMEVITEDQTDYYVEYPSIIKSKNVFYFNFNNYIEYNDILKKYEKDFFIRKSFENLNILEDSIIHVKKILKYHYNKKVSFHWKSLLFELFENDHVNTELPFKRDLMIVRNVYQQIVAICHISGLLFKSHNINDLDNDKISVLFEKNSDLREDFNNHFGNNEKDILSDYINAFYQHNFIDSIYVDDKYRNKGICEKMYMSLFNYYNKDGVINLTSGKKHQQSKEIQNLWIKLFNKYPTQVFLGDDFNYILF